MYVWVYTDRGKESRKVEKREGTQGGYMLVRRIVNIVNMIEHGILREYIISVQAGQHGTLLFCGALMLASMSSLLVSATSPSPSS